MNKIESINLFRLRNNEHFQFMTDVDVLINKHNAKELLIDGLYPTFKQVLSTEDVAMRVELGSSKSQMLVEIDSLRDQIWNAIATRIKSTVLSPFDDEVISGQTLQRIIDLYGDLRSLSYNEESAAISNLISDLQKPENSSHLDKACIKAWVSELKKENDNFQTVFNQRATELAGRNNGDVRNVRKNLDPVFLQIVEKINATIVIEIAKPSAALFTAELNEKIKYYKIVLATRAGRSKAKIENPDDTIVG